MSTVMTAIRSIRTAVEPLARQPDAVTVSFMKALSPVMMGIESGAMAVISFARSRAVVTDVWMWANHAMTETRRLVM